MATTTTTSEWVYSLRHGDDLPPKAPSFVMEVRLMANPSSSTLKQTTSSELELQPLHHKKDKKEKKEKKQSSKGKGKEHFVEPIDEHQLGLDRFPDDRIALDPFVQTLHQDGKSFVISDALAKDMPIVYASPKFLEYTGYARQDVIGRNCRFLQGDRADQQAELEKLKNAMLAKKEICVRLLNYRKDKTLFWNLLLVRPVIVDQEVRYFVGVQTPLEAEAAQPNHSVDPRTSPLDNVRVRRNLAAEVQNEIVSEERKAQLARGGETKLALVTQRPPDYPIFLQFEDLAYEIEVAPPDDSLIPAGFRKIKKVKRTILSNVTGSVSPGEVLAIMGPTGCGKTSLLNIFSGRVTNGVSGNVMINGQAGEISDHKRRIAYVLQDDLLLSNLTVRQNLTFTAQLRLPRELSSQEKTDRVDEVIDALNLRKCVDTFVGGGMDTIFGRAVRGVSGGERKRANIGNELLTNPSMILLDEPTSGLDSSTALALLTTIKELAAGGRTVITTLHQPSSQMFEMFDKLLLMVDGRIVFFGKAKDALAYFASWGLRCAPFYNPADFFMGLVTDEELKNAAPIKKKLIEAYEEFSKSGGHFTPRGTLRTNSSANLLQNSQNNVTKPRNFSDAAKRQQQMAKAAVTKQTARKYPTTWTQQVQILFQRQWLLTAGSLDIFPFIQIILVAIMVGVLWWRKPNTDENVPVKNGALFFGIVFASGFAPLFISLTQFPGERGILVKERASGSYRLSAYFIAKRLAEIPFEMIYPFIYTLIMYWMIGFRADAHFLSYLALALVINNASSAFGLASRKIGAAWANMKAAITVATVVMLTLMMGGGFYIPVSKLPGWLRWVKWVSYLRYGYDAVVMNEYVGRSVRLVPNANFFSDERMAYLNSINATRANGSFVLQELEISGTLWVNALALCGFAILYHVLAYLAMAFFVNY